MTEQAQTGDELVAVYLRIRNAMHDMEDRHKQELAEIKGQLDVVSDKLLELCNEQNIDGFKTAAGTVSRRISSRYWTSDWESFFNFVREHDAMDLFERRIHQGNMKQFLEENPDEFPIGLQSDRKYTIQVRKPTAR